MTKMPVTNQPTRYKGYWIEENSLNGAWLISKDGAHISYATSLEHAQQIIDELV